MPEDGELVSSGGEEEERKAGRRRYRDPSDSDSDVPDAKRRRPSRRYQSPPRHRSPRRHRSPSRDHRRERREVALWERPRKRRFEEVSSEGRKHPDSTRPEPSPREGRQPPDDAPTSSNAAVSKLSRPSVRATEQPQSLSKQPHTAASIPPLNEGVRFLTKAQREALKAQQQAEKEAARQKEEENLSRKRSEFFTRESRALAEERVRKQQEAEAERRRKEEDRKRRETEEAERRHAGNSKKKRRDSDEDEYAGLTEAEKLKLQEEKEREQIREQYLGTRKEKKKVQKPSEKFRNIFQFDWDDSEDTTRGDLNPLYHRRHEPQLLFGRGFIAGIDVRDQRRRNMFYDQLARKRREKLEELTALGLQGDELAEALSVLNLTGDQSVMNEMAIARAEMSDEEMEDTHWSTKTAAEMTDRDWRIFREDFSIFVKGGRVPNPIRLWSESGLHPEILGAIKEAGYEKPTPIQMQAIPVAKEMRDLIGIAETGSGKTAAFMLPMLTYVARLPRLDDESAQSGPYGLVLAPTRELAQQIRDETEKFSGTLKIRSVAIVGGRSAEVQAFELRRGVEIVIGTPGRIKDCLEKAYTVLIQCNYVVLDEADRMIDMGFEDVVNWILDQIPSSNMKSSEADQVSQEELQAKAGHRQYRITQMFSATMPASVERLARRYLRQPSIISIGHPGQGKQSIEQRLEFVSEARKRQRLVEILSEAAPPVIIFVNQKKNADIIAKALHREGFRATALHGGKAQDIREASLEQFKSGEYDILVATDVAGRGIDVEDVQLVLNYDMPKEIEGYTHRIGRTGRAGKKGLAISLVTEEDSGVFFDLRNLLVSTNNIVPQELANHPASKQKPQPQTGPGQQASGVPQRATAML